MYGKMIVLGITGGIASGKSSVSRILKELGAEIIDADVVAREIVEPGEPALNDIAEAFGRDMIREDGSLDRRKLGRLVFQDPESLRKLNEITHPRILARIRERLDQIMQNPSKPELVVIDAAILMDTELVKMVDRVLVVTAPTDLRIKRIMERDGLTLEEAKNRIDSQTPQYILKKHADYVLEADGSLDELRRKVERFWRNITRDTGHL